MRGAVLALALCVAAPAGAAPARGAPGFDPLAYFAGVTTSRGAMTDGFGAPAGTVSGRTTGRRMPDRATSFDQVIRMDDGKERRRSFRLVRTGPTTIEATGSEVVGTARGTLDGRTLRLLSTIRSEQGNPFSDVEFEQVMQLQPDGRALTNSSTVRKLGFVVRRIEERFVRSGRR